MVPPAPGGGTIAGSRLGRRRSTAGSDTHARICRSTRRSASAASHPSARADAYIASACCASSSRTSSSTPVRAARMRFLTSINGPFVSGRGDPGDAVQRGVEALPHAALARERLPAGARQLVVAAAALPGPLDPAPFDQPAVLEAVQRRVERGDVEADGPLGTAGNQLADLVAMPLALFEQREDQELGAPPLQFVLEFVPRHLGRQPISQEA